MSLFITSPPNRHGVFAVDQPAPSVVQSSATNVAVAVGQFPWGPSQALTYPSSIGDFYQTFAPAGMVRTGSAFLSIIRKAWGLLGGLRVADPTAVAATGAISSSSPTVLVNFAAKCTGSQGNSIILTVGAADDGISGHWNLTVQVSGTSGTTTEIYRNNNVTGTGSDVLPNFTNSVLMASATKAASGTPVNGNTTLTGGTDGTITSTLYVGTAGADDKGLALLESDTTIRHVFTDDCGSSLRAAVNAGLQAHAELLTNRMCYLNGVSGQTAAQAQTDVANYRSIRCVYVDPWAKVADTVDGTVRLAPSSCWAASVASQLPPSVSIAWKNDLVSGMLAGIAGLEFDRGVNAGQNTASGICTLIRRAGSLGGYAFEAGKNTSLTAGQTNITRTRMGQYIAQSAVDSWQPYVDGPNIPFYQQDIINGLDIFLAQLKANANINPAFFPFITDYAIKATSASNTNASIANGDFTVAAEAQLGSAMERIYLSLQYGESVVIQAA